MRYKEQWLLSFRWSVHLGGRLCAAFIVVVLPTNYVFVGASAPAL